MAKNNKRYVLMETTIIITLIVFSIIYMLISLGNTLWLIIGVFVFLLLITAIRILFSILMLKNNQKGIRKEKLIDMVTNIIPGGCMEFSLDNELSIIEINDKFLKFTGYTKEEIENIFNNKYLSMIESSEREKVINVLRHQSTKQSKSQLYYKQLCKNGEKKGIINVFHIYENKKGGKNVHCFLIDPSHLKQIKLEKDIDNERYKIVAEQSESIIFDVDIADGSIYMNSHFKEKFGYQLDKKCLRSTLVEELIYPDDLQKFKDLENKHDEYNEIEIRIKKIDNNYIWCKLRVSTIFDEDQKPVRRIGKIIDVDNSRREKFMLIEKTKIDTMSGFYNKQATENIINDEITRLEKDTLSALLVMDIDNFKEINDKFGHIKGDEVLIEISNSVKPLFRSSDILGRVGGDEFVIFLKDLNTEDHATKKAQDILDAIKSIVIGNKEYEVSVSIGIAFYDKDGSDYKELFDKADKALYKAKKKGKKTFELS